MKSFSLFEHFVLRAQKDIQDAPKWDPYDLEPGKELAGFITDKLGGPGQARVVGGAVRDYHFGKPFKDIDIAIYGQAYNREYVQDRVLATIPDLEILDGGEANYEGQPVRWVIKCEYRGIPVDVVQWQHHRTIEDMLRHFDLNLNTYWLTSGGMIRALPGTCRRSDGRVQLLTPHRGIDARFRKRIARLSAKYPALDWGYDNRLVEILQHR